MAILEIRKFSKHQANEIFRKVSQNVEKIDTKIVNLLADMTETLQNNGGNGLAAPQIGVSLRLIVVKNRNDYIKLINPVIIKSIGEQISFEGCLSLPGIYGKLKRPEFMLIHALDINGKPIEIRAFHRLAIICDHEIDHLEGVMFIDKVNQIVTYNSRYN
jgi:peptide deformylase